MGRCWFALSSLQCTRPSILSFLLSIAIFDEGIFFRSVSRLPRSPGLVQFHRGRPDPPGSCVAQWRKKEAPTDQNKRNDLSDETGDVPEGTAKPDYKGRMRSATTFRVAGLRMHSETKCRAARQRCRECRAKDKGRTREIVQPLQEGSSCASEYQMYAVQHTIQSYLCVPKTHG